MELHDFNPTDLPQSGVAVAVGRCKTGKSVLFRDLVRRNAHRFHFVVVFTRRLEKKKWQTMWNTLVNPPAFRVCVQFRLRYARTLLDLYEKANANEQKNHVLFVLDEMDIPFYTYMPLNLLNRFQAAGILLLKSDFTMKDVCLEALLTGVIRLLFHFGDTDDYRKRVYDQCGMRYEVSRADFDALMQRATANWGAIVLWQEHRDSNRLSDYVLRYTAELS